MLYYYLYKKAFYVNGHKKGFCKKRLLSLYHAISIATTLRLINIILWMLYVCRNYWFVLDENCIIYCVNIYKNKWAKQLSDRHDRHTYYWCPSESCKNVYRLFCDDDDVAMTHKYNRRWKGSCFSTNNWIYIMFMTFMCEVMA